MIKCQHCANRARVIATDSNGILIGRCKTHLPTEESDV